MAFKRKVYTGHGYTGDVDANIALRRKKNHYKELLSVFGEKGDIFSIADKEQRETSLSDAPFLWDMYRHNIGKYGNFAPQLQTAALAGTVMPLTLLIPISKKNAYDVLVRGELPPFSDVEASFNAFCHGEPALDSDVVAYLAVPARQFLFDNQISFYDDRSTGKLYLFSRWNRPINLTNQTLSLIVDENDKELWAAVITGASGLRKYHYKNTLKERLKDMENESLLKGWQDFASQEYGVFSPIGRLFPLDEYSTRDGAVVKTINDTEQQVLSSILLDNDSPRGQKQKLKMIRRREHRKNIGFVPTYSFQETLDFNPSWDRGSLPLLPLRTRDTVNFDGDYSKEQFDKVLDAAAILRRAEVLDGLAVDTGEPVLITDSHRLNGDDFWKEDKRISEPEPPCKNNVFLYRNDFIKKPLATNVFDTVANMLFTHQTNHVDALLYGEGENRLPDTRTVIAGIGEGRLEKPRNRGEQARQRTIKVRSYWTRKVQKALCDAARKIKGNGGEILFHLLKEATPSSFAASPLNSVPNMSPYGAKIRKATQEPVWDIQGVNTAKFIWDKIEEFGQRARSSGQNRSLHRKEKEIIDFMERAYVQGVPLNIDHIVPLSSLFICGLNVPENYQILDAETNQKKGNYFWEGMPEYTETDVLELIEMAENAGLLDYYKINKALKKIEEDPIRTTAAEFKNFAKNTEAFFAELENYPETTKERADHIFRVFTGEGMRSQQTRMECIGDHPTMPEIPADGLVKLINGLAEMRGGWSLEEQEKVIAVLHFHPALSRIVPKLNIDSGLKKEFEQAYEPYGWTPTTVALSLCMKHYPSYTPFTCYVKKSETPFKENNADTPFNRQRRKELHLYAQKLNQDCLLRHLHLVEGSLGNQDHQAYFVDILHNALNPQPNFSVDPHIDGRHGHWNLDEDEANGFDRGDQERQSRKQQQQNQSFGSFDL